LMTTAEQRILWDFKSDATFQRITRLGSGSYGEVYKAVKDADGKAYFRGEKVDLYAVKKFVNVGLDDINREVRILLESRNNGLCNPNVICYVDHYRGRPSNDYIVVTRLVSGTVIYNLKEVPSNEKFRAILQSLLEGLHYLHSKNIVHRDIHGDNVMIMNYETPNPSAVYLDLGLGCDSEADCIAQDRSIYQYKSPEQLEGKTLTLPEFKSSDVWFLAQTVYYMASRKLLIGSALFAALTNSLQILKSRRQLVGDKPDRLELEKKILKTKANITKELQDIHSKLITYDANGNAASLKLAVIKDDLCRVIVTEMLRLKWKRRLLPLTGIMLLEKEDYKLKKSTV